MSDRLSKSEVELLREEVDDLQVAMEEVSRVERIVNGTPWHVRLWRRVFGRLIYDGPETCGHCKYWMSPARKPHWEYNVDKGKTEYVYDGYYRGDCKILFGGYNTTEKEGCERFTPLRRYKRRVRD